MPSFWGSASSLSPVRSESLGEECDEEDSLPFWRKPLLDLSRAGVRQWYRLWFLGRTLVSWRSLASDSRARRLVRKVCADCRARVLSTRAFAALASHRQQCRARAEAIGQVVEQWKTERLLERLVEALSLWRSRAAKGAIRRRGGKLLSRWVDLNCCRRFLTLWRRNVQRALRISEGILLLQGAVRRKYWHAAFTSWQQASRRSVASVAVAEHLEVKRAAALLSGWAHLRRAKAQRFLHLANAAWKGWECHCRRERAGATVKCSLRNVLARSVVRRWSAAAWLARCEQHLRARVEADCLRKVLRSWAQLSAAAGFAVRHLAVDALLAWHEVAGRLASDRFQREKTILGSTFGESSAPATGWQQKQFPRLLSRYLLAWHKTVVTKKMWRCREVDSQQHLKRQSAARTLWFWHESARRTSARRDQIQRASTTLTAMVAASRWARAHDALVVWFTRTKARRMKCDVSALSPECHRLMTSDALGDEEATAGSQDERLHLAHTEPVAMSTPMLRTPEASFASEASKLPQRAPGSLAAAALRSASSGASALPHERAAPQQMGSLVPMPRASAAMGRWLKWTMALWLSNAAALPVLQWSMSLWRGAILHAELHRLRWWSLMTRQSALRRVELRRDLRRLRQAFKHWWDATAESLREAVAAAAAALQEVSGISAGPAWAEPVTQQAVEDHATSFQSLGQQSRGASNRATGFDSGDELSWADVSCVERCPQPTQQLELWRTQQMRPPGQELQGVAEPLRDSAWQESPGASRDEQRSPIRQLIDTTLDLRMRTHALCQQRASNGGLADVPLVPVAFAA
eukprot:TRINITY_DN32120_c0_g1_i2.p1 TRINITY_DN32120_c0_g1~~TRINITY_DN32120_c0_g1_i2.p1  ORF type:complete len:808 (+),score=123.05 TRINITY_DN32120_c0_g1_i2:18-2441(+)